MRGACGFLAGERKGHPQELIQDVYRYIWNHDEDVEFTEEALREEEYNEASLIAGIEAVFAKIDYWESHK